MSMFEEQTPFLVFSNILILLINYSLLSKVLKKNSFFSNSRYRWAVFFSLLFCLYSFWGTDWFHYQTAFEQIKREYPVNFEDVYIWIAHDVAWNYFVFRLIIWGSALFLFIKTVERLSVSKYIAFFLFSCVFIIWFSYARVSLAMSMVYYGFSLLYKPFKNKKKSIILAVLCIGCSFFFHKSAIFAIVLTIASYVILRIPEKFYVFLIYVYPLLLMLVKFKLSSFMMDDLSDSSDDLSSYMTTGQAYMQLEVRSKGVGWFVSYFLEVCPYFLLAFLSIKTIMSKNIKLPIDVGAFFVLLFMIVYCSSFFMFDLGMNTQTIFGRFLRFAALPACIVLAYLYEHQIYPRLTKLTIVLACLGTYYAVLYCFYNSFF